MWNGFWDTVQISVLAAGVVSVVLGVGYFIYAGAIDGLGCENDTQFEARFTSGENNTKVATCLPIETLPDRERAILSH